VAEAMGAAGAHVVMAGRTAPAMEQSRERIAAAGATAQVRVLDVRDVAAVRALVESAASEAGRLDIVVNNAGLSYPEPIMEGDPGHWREMLETNVLALAVGSQAAARVMRARGSGGHIVNISSIAALRPDSGVYGATKHAVNCISATLRRELMNEPIQVITIMPGAVATSFARNFDPSVLEGLTAVAGGSGVGTSRFVQGERLPDEVLGAAHRAMPDYLCAPEDVADAVVWAVTRPPHVLVPEVVVRPKRDLPL
jgi:NADP-dependent 3-hydroxy acid dehydrogenase YdfG